MKTYRVIAALLALVMLLGMFSGCSKNGREKKKEIEATADSKNTTNLQTVLAAIARQYNQVGFCDSRIPIFDGKRRFDAIFRDEGKKR